MPVKNYVSRNGQIEYEIDENGEILTYGRDALGNVVVGYDKNTNAVFTIDYKPFGEFGAVTGNISGRRFLWAGTWAYRFTPSVPISHYVRARHLSMRMGSWTTVDRLWPTEMAYGYVNGQVVSAIDPFGLIIVPIVCAGACVGAGGCLAGVQIACGALRGMPEYDECVSDFILSLPPHSQAGCGASLIGCMACLRRKLPFPLPKTSGKAPPPPRGEGTSTASPCHSVAQSAFPKFKAQQNSTLVLQNPGNLRVPAFPKWHPRFGNLAKAIPAVSSPSHPFGRAVSAEGELHRSFRFTLCVAQCKDLANVNDGFGIGANSIDQMCQDACNAVINGGCNLLSELCQRNCLRPGQNSGKCKLCHAFFVLACPRNLPLPND